MTSSPCGLGCCLRRGSVVVDLFIVTAIVGIRNCSMFCCISILLKEPFALKNSETVYFTSIFSTPSYSDIVPIDNFDLTFFYFYFVFEVFDTIQF